MDLETGLYHDNPEFDDVVDKLSNDLFQISSTNGRLSELLRRDRKSGDRRRSTHQQMELVQQNQQVFRDLKPEIEELQQWEDPTSAQKYSQHKIAADFGRLFVEFKTIQEQVLQLAKETPPQANGKRQGSLIELSSGIDEPAAGSTTATAAAAAAALAAADDAEPLLVPEQTQAFEDQLAQDEVSYQQGLVAEREQEIENVAQGMNELNEIYMNLGTIVREQGVSLDNIEANLYSVANNVRNGSSQLTKAHNWQRRSSGRMCCFLIILLVIALFIILASSV